MNILSEKNKIIQKTFGQIFFLGLCLLLLLFLMQSNIVEAAEEHDPRLIDDADLLSDEQEKIIIEKLNEISKKYQQDVVIVTVYSIEGKTATEFADDYYDYHNYGFSDERDGILFLLSMEYRDWAISTTGQSITVFTDAGLEYMTDEFLPEISKGNYEAGFTKFIELADQFFKQAEKGKPYDVNYLPKGPLGWHWLLITFIVSALLALTILQSMKNKLVSVKRKSAANDYIKPNSFVLTDQKDLFLYRNIAVTKIPKNTSSGGRTGGSSTHTSSSGSSHGGSSGKF